MLRRCTQTCLLALLFGCALYAYRADAQDSGRLFPQTGYTVRGALLGAWQQHGLELFGYPISPEFSERNRDNGETYTVQYFERVRLELHPTASQTVQIGRLGAELLPSIPFAASATPGDGCLSFAETGQSLCGSFASYWNTHGALTRFGYPLAPISSYRNQAGQLIEVQYTERARFERVAGRSEVLLGLLGRERYQPPPGVPTTPPAPMLSAEAARLLELINAERAAAGLGPLDIARELLAAAQAHSQDMATAGQISHTGSDGRGAAQRMSDAGYGWSRCGENIAVGQQTPELAMSFWMNSPPHRANILDPGMSEVGIGYVRQASGYEHYWTIDLGQRR